jgi:hypothetical protein
VTRALRHVTLSTGHTRDSPRSEVDDAAVAVCSRLLDEARAGGRPEVPGTPGLRLRVTREGRCLLATVAWPDGAPVITYGVASHSRCGAQLWRLLHGADPSLYGTLATDPERAPSEPWLAVRIEPGVALLADLRDTMLLLADFGRCLAWAALDPVEIH